MSAAPTAEVAIGPDLSLAPPEAEMRREVAAALPRELLLCGGRGRSGSLSRTSEGVRLACVFSHTVQPCDAVFTVRLDAAEASDPADGAPLSWHALLLMSGSENPNPNPSPNPKP